MTDSLPIPDIEKLVNLVARLRAPDGCPWDQEQTIPDLRAYLLEEAHEVADAIDRGALGELSEELGDLLFQVVFLAHLGQEEGAFDLNQVIDGIHSKMIRRHPHVFGSRAADGERTEGTPGTAADEDRLDNADAVRTAWEVRKSRENEGKRALLAGVPRSLPALLGAYRMGQKAAGVGFDWPDLGGAWSKIDEEYEELRTAVHRLEAAVRDDNAPSLGHPSRKDAQAATRAAVQDEVGDLLFAVVNLARKLDIDPEAALAGTNQKFRRRFGAVEDGLRERGIPLGEASLELMDSLWNRAKKGLRKD